MVPRISEPPVAMTPPSVEVEESPSNESVSNDATTITKYDTFDVDPSRPYTPRRATAPDVPNVQTPFSNLPTSTLPLPPRTRSPFNRGHGRSRSSGGSLSAPQMTRAHSSPVPNTSTRPVIIQRPSSPLGPASRHRSPMRTPLRKNSEESFSSYGSGLDIDQTISEHSELDLTPRATLDHDSMPASPTPYSYQTFPRNRRRPTSPLYQITQTTFSPSTPKNTLRPCTSSPSLAASHYNEAYPSSHSSSGSIPSTPTSLRSRSPSISSLETIPDSPDAEMEAENIAKLKAAADREDQSEEGLRRRMTLDAGARGGIRDKRKRWSVCGAERRGDLSLETIWEG